MRIAFGKASNYATGAGFDSTPSHFDYFYSFMVNSIPIKPAKVLVGIFLFFYSFYFGNIKSIIIFAVLITIKQILLWT